MNLKTEKNRPEEVHRLKFLKKSNYYQVSWKHIFEKRETVHLFVKVSIKSVSVKLTPDRRRPVDVVPPLLDVSSSFERQAQEGDAYAISVNGKILS